MLVTFTSTSSHTKVLKFMHSYYFQFTPFITPAKCAVLINTKYQISLRI